MSFHKLMADDSTHFPLHRSTLPGYKVPIMSQYTHSFIHWLHPRVALCSKMLWMKKGAEGLLKDSPMNGKAE